MRNPNLVQGRKVKMKGRVVMLLVLCVLAGTGWVYAQPQPGSPWPMIHHDQYHTGRSPYNGPETPTIRWTFAMGDRVGTSPAIAEDGTIYIVSVDGYLYAVNPNGTEKWRLYIHGGGSSPAIGADGTIYVGDYAPLFYAVNPSGTVKWTYDMGGYTWPTPTIGQDGRIYVGSMGAPSTFCALNPDGTAEWTYSIMDHFHESPSIGLDGTTHIRAADGYLYAITSTGSLRWRYFIGVQGGVYRAKTSVSGEDGTIYTGGIDGNLYALTPDSTLKWTFPTRGWIVSAPAIGEDGTIYFGSLDSTFYALNPNGTLKWSFPATGSISSSAAIDSNGTIYFGTWGYDTTTARVYVLNPDGSLVWSYGMPGRVGSSPAIGSDGTLYIGCEDGKLYAFRTPTGTEELKESASGGQVFRYRLLQNYPNPCGELTIISYQLPKPGHTTLEIYDLTGRLVRTLVDEKKEAGVHSIPWDGKDVHGKEVASGIYFYRLQADDFTGTKSLTLLR